MRNIHVGISPALSHCSLWEAWQAQNGELDVWAQAQNGELDVVIPKDVTQGQAMDVEYAGTKFTVVVPEGFNPGSVWRLQLPVPLEPSDHFPVHVAPPSLESIFEQMDVILPPDVASGQNIEVEHSGRRHSLSVPPGFKAGSILPVQLLAQELSEQSMRFEQLDVIIPEEVWPGENVDFEHWGRKHSVSVPQGYGCLPGSILPVLLPPTPQPPQSLAPSVEPSVPLPQLNVTIPSNAAPGQNIEVEQLGKKYSVIVPPGYQPGSILPIHLPEADLLLQSQTPPQLGSMMPFEQLDVILPTDVAPGQAIEVEHSGKFHHVIVPHGCLPGSVLRVQLQECWHQNLMMVGA